MSATKPDGRGRVWRDPAGAAAVAVLVAQLVWRGYYLSQGFFAQDDFVMLHLGRTRLPSPAYLWQDYAGHLFPGGFALAFLQARLGALSWTAAWIPVVLAQASAGALAWLLLSRLLDRSWARIPLLALFCFCPLTLGSTQWWAVAVQFLPVELCGLGAALAMLSWRQDGDRRGRLACVLLVAVGLLFQERGLLVPLLVLLTVLVVDDGQGVDGQGVDGQGVWARVVAAVRTDRSVWLWLVGLDVGYLLLHVWLAPLANTGRPAGGSAAALVTDFALRNLAPGLFGGPWTGTVLGGPALIPATWSVWLCGVLLAAAVALGVWRGGTTGRIAWIGLGAYAACDVALLFGGRAFFGEVLGYSPRYTADVVPVAMVAAAGVLRGLRGPRPRPGTGPAGTPARRSLVLAALGVAVAYTASAAVTSLLVAPSSYHTTARSYVANLRANLAAQPAVTLYDGRVPSDVLLTWFGSQDRVSTILGIASGAPPFDAPSQQLRTVSADGRLVPVSLVNPVAARDGPVSQCGYAVSSAPVLVAMQAPVPFAANVLEIGYYTDDRGRLVLSAGGASAVFPVEPGLHVIDIVLTAGFDDFSVRLAGSAGTVCLTNASAGVPRQPR